MSVTIDGTTGISGVAGSASAPALIGTDADSGYYINSANEPSASVNGTAVWNANSTFGFKNRIINGNMVVAQYGTSNSVSVGQTGYSVDRFRCDAPLSVGSAITTAQVVDSPAGFYYSLKYTAGTGTTNASDSCQIFYAIEGNNVADMNWGTANAKAFTISFWAKSSLTGSFGLVLEETTGLYQYLTTYSLPAANTWTLITLNISAPLSGGTSGAWAYGTGRGLVLRWDMGSGTSRSGAATNAWGNSSSYTGVSGTTKLTQTTGATFQITGVQLEKGSTATSFDFRDYGRELIMCQRYYQTYSAPNYPGFHYSTSAYAGVILPVAMRATPTTVTSSNTTWYEASTTYTFTPSSVVGQSIQSVSIQGSISGGTNGYAGTFQASFTASAEL